MRPSELRAMRGGDYPIASESRRTEFDAIRALCGVHDLSGARVAVIAGDGADQQARGLFEAEWQWRMQVYTCSGLHKDGSINTR